MKDQMTIEEKFLLALVGVLTISTVYFALAMRGYREQYQKAVRERTIIVVPQPAPQFHRPVYNRA